MEKIFVQNHHRHRQPSCSRRILFFCDSCQRGFSQPDLLVNHQRQVHPIIEHFKQNNIYYYCGENIPGQNPDLRRCDNIKDNKRPPPPPSTATCPHFAAQPNGDTSRQRVSQIPIPVPVVMETNSDFFVVAPETKNSGKIMKVRRQEQSEAYPNPLEYAKEFEGWLQKKREETIPIKIMTEEPPLQSHLTNGEQQMSENVGQNPTQNLSKMSPPSQEIFKKPNGVASRIDKNFDETKKCLSSDNYAKRIGFISKPQQVEVSDDTGTGRAHFKATVAATSGWSSKEGGQKFVKKGSKCPDLICLDNDDNSPSQLRTNKDTPKAEYNGQCKICGGTWPSAQSLMVHLMTHLSQSGNLVGGQTGNRSTNLNTLKEEQILEAATNRPTVDCKSCGMSFSDIEIYERHLTTCHPAPRASVSSARASSAKDPKPRSRIGKKDSFEYKCRYCDKLLSTKWTREAHERHHTGQLPLKCRFCAKPLNNIHHLTVHERIHTGEKPFVCPDCHRPFSTSSSFKRQSIKFHGSLSEPGRQGTYAGPGPGEKIKNPAQMP